MSERTKFILDWERRWEALEGRGVNVAELCRIHGISRQTGHLWITRYVDGDRDLRVLEEGSRRPQRNPRAVTSDIEDQIVVARKQYPRWGPVMLRGWLVPRFPRTSFPSPSCIGAILKRRGLTASKRRARPSTAAPITPPFAGCNAPNEVWCMDFKGWFLNEDGVRCYPFTLLDGFSRFLLRCEALLDPDGEHVIAILDSAFREYGLPKRMRSDGGPPFFAAKSPASLSKVSIWLLRLGIELECIAPAKPQQNGRLERFHRTLKLEVPIAASIRPQQRGFDEFRRVYNFERPHSALDLMAPWTVYRRSREKYPRPLLQTDGLIDHLEQVDKRGFISWRKRRVFIGEAFAFEKVSLFPTDGMNWEVYFGVILLGRISAQAPTVFSPTRRPKGAMRVSFQQSDGWETMPKNPE